MEQNIFPPRSTKRHFKKQVTSILSDGQEGGRGWERRGLCKDGSSQTASEDCGGDFRVCSWWTLKGVYDTTKFKNHWLHIMNTPNTERYTNTGKFQEDEMINVALA